MSVSSKATVFVDRERELDRIAVLLKTGQLGLLLGAGVSIAQGLPGWLDLTRRCIDKCGLAISIDATSPPAGLMEVMDRVKEVCNDEHHYHTLVSEMLYQGVDLDISRTRKELLIALSSLMVGTTRARVNLVMTLNFDSILEWYLAVNGLRVLTTSERWCIRPEADVEVVHYHGYLPHPLHLNQRPSNRIVLSYTEVSAHEREQGYWRDRLYDFFRSKVFLSVGVNPQTLLNNIRGYIAHVSSLYRDSGMARDLPFGFALFPPGEASVDDLGVLLRTGIIPLETDHSDTPSAVLDIAQRSVGLKMVGTYSGVSK